MKVSQGHCEASDPEESFTDGSEFPHRRFLVFASSLHTSGKGTMSTIHRLIALAALLGALACSGEAKPASAPAAGTATDFADPASSDPRAAIFLAKGCPQCHSISALGVKSPAEIGPDLTIAYEDVQSRFSVPLEEFLHNPTGTMQVVLSSQIQLSSTERDSIIHILKELHEQSKESEEDHD
jgi:hypothetical protein